jgi:antitoxin (DNA-binding transcriptional repressor) of toxin-antitoxin stability system
MTIKNRGFGESTAVFRRGEPSQSQQVREVQASVAKTHFSQLLDEVERGATIVVLRHGKAIAHIIPDPEARAQRRREAVANIRRLGEEVAKRNGPISVEEIISSIHEGHKY